jgi:endo-1,4-beta-D-glucanase Y
MRLNVRYEALTVAGIAILSAFFLESSSVLATGLPSHPFPQQQTYAAGSIRPSDVSQAVRDQQVRDFYDYWKARYLVPAGVDSDGNQLYRIAFGFGSDVTVSEGQGFGMIIVAIMAGHDPDAQALFDGLHRFTDAFPSGIDSRLMTWKVQNGQPIGGNASAFDGDADIAFALLLAAAQWQEAAEVDYSAEAADVIAGLLQSVVGRDSRLPMLGDWVAHDGSPYNQYTPRLSDFMLAHFRAFRRATGDASWDTVIANTLAVMEALQRNHSATTGLLPDFAVACDPVDNCTPAAADFLEGPHDGQYYYNAGRIPFRVGLDALLNDSPRARAVIEKTIDWLSLQTGGEVRSIKAGYQLDGTPIGDYFTTFFAAPFGVAAMTNGIHQTFLNDIYASVANTYEDYYEDSVTLLSLLVMTGNFWDPTTNGPSAPDCVTDADANMNSNALTDGVLLIRSLFGFTEGALIDGALAPDALRTEPTAIAAHVATHRAALDVDANGSTDAGTDGLLVIRRLFGFTGPALTNGVVAADATRSDPFQIADYIDALGLCASTVAD